jgi:histidinol dehydrogenase
MNSRPRKIIPILSLDTLPDLWNKMVKRNSAVSPRLEGKVRRILHEVRMRGDEAVLEYTEKPDGLKLHAKDLPVDTARLRQCATAADPHLVMDFQKAVFNLTAFHRRQIQKSWEYEHDGAVVGQRVTPMESIGIIVPEGEAACPSYILMTVIPAKVAGVKRIVVACHAAGLDHPSLAAVLSLLGIREIYRVGGAPAIAALAYGTETIPKVDKIVASGDAHVAAARRLIQGTVDVDMLAGFSELIVIADETASPRAVAADMLAQAEVGPTSCAICITDSRPQATLIQSEVEKQLRGLPRKSVAVRSLTACSAILLVKELAEAIGIVNQCAPQHLELQVEDPDRFLSRIHHAGAIFLGSATPAAVGDCLSGSGRILPDCGTARFLSPLGVYNFQKHTNVIRLSRERLMQSLESIERMAVAEGMHGHAGSAAMRFEGQGNDENPV